MEAISIIPKKEQKNLWFIYWVIPFVFGLVLWLILMLIVDKLIFGLFIVGWLIIMLPILIWIPAFFRSLEYSIDNEAVKIKKGVFWRKIVTIPYTKITNIDITQGPVQRMFNIGIIHVQTAGAGGAESSKAELKMWGVRDLEGLKESIMEKVRDDSILKPHKVNQELGEESDSQILKHILIEIKSIRDALEKR
jgi:hypothetical protein